MKHYIILLALSVAWASDPETRSCDSNPCEHICNVDGSTYNCECFPNYDKHPDGRSCTPKIKEALDKTYMGCWQDKAEHRDLRYFLWTRPNDASITECVHDCRAQSFRFAGLQSGTDCWCDNTFQRAYNETGVCNMNCPGAPGMKCGGELSNSIYRVNKETRYMGCYNEDINNPDLQEILWDNTAGNSVDLCIRTCASNGYNFAGLYDGGQCTCGNSFGRHGPADEGLCDVRCYNGWAEDNCGGNATNAIYRVVKGRDITETLASDEDVRADIPLNILFQYPHLMGVFGDRVMVYASDTVNTVLEDETCTTGACYSLCGSINHPPGLDKYSANLTIREFYLKMSDIPGRVNYPDQVERVYVYVQTLYVDQTTYFPWTMYIHARQIIVNYEAAPEISYEHTGPLLDFNRTYLYHGPPSDTTFQKLSLLCARMMLSSPTDDDRRVGWNIIDDLARGITHTPEDQRLNQVIKAVRSEYTSIYRNDVHWAPYYTMDFYSHSLGIYYDQITVYYNEFSDMLDSALECQQFVDRAGTLIQVWTDAVISEALIIQQYAETALNTSAAVYQENEDLYEIAMADVDAAAEEFEKGLKKWKRQQAVKAMRGLITSVFKLMRGKFPCGALDVVRDLGSAVDGVIIGLELLEVTMENLAKTNEELFAFIDIADEIFASKDFMRYMDNVASVAALHIMIEEWDNFRYQVDVIFREPEFENIEGALGYRDSILTMCDFGEELTRSVTEYATNIRRYMATTANVELKKEMQERYREYFQEVQADCTRQEQVLIKFAEQNYDIMIDLNDQLIQFCQAMFYEQMQYCPENIRPNFAYNIQSLLANINAAQLAASSYVRGSPASLSIPIVDDSSAWNNCTNMSICPIKVFRESGILYYSIPTDHPMFAQMDLFLVEEITVTLDGVTSTGSRTDLRLLISSSGPFQNKLNAETATFLTRPISKMIYQYDIETGETELAADLYRPSGAMIRHMTPFTTWVIKVDPTFTHIDISQVERVVMKFVGPFV